MKFELKPYNYGLSDDELLDDLRSVARHLRKDKVTKEEYDQHGRLCSATFRKRFGSWGKAHDLAGLKRSRYDQMEPAEYIADVCHVAATLKKNSLTCQDYEAHGKFSYASVIRNLGPWETVLDQAGLKRAANFNPRISDDSLFENLEHLWITLGRQPTKKDFVKPLSRYSYDPYPRRFGSFRKALEAFVEYIQNVPSPESESEEITAPDDACSQRVYRHKTK